VPGLSTLKECGYLSFTAMQRVGGDETPAGVLVTAHEGVAYKASPAACDSWLDGAESVQPAPGGRGKKGHSVTKLLNTWRKELDLRPLFQYSQIENLDSRSGGQ
jgi:hypothetical protein